MPSAFSHIRRKASVLILSSFSFFPISGKIISRWATHWTMNRSSIIAMTSVNTVLTAGMEFISRSVSAEMLPKSEANSYRFIVVDSDGKSTINRQSLINIFMTFFASLLGGPVFFFSKRSQRFIFFVCFGIFNSLISQMASHLVITGLAFVTVSRFLFDVIYNGTFKFAIFEWLRMPLRHARVNVARIGYLRIGQDFLTTCIRVLMLNLLGFKG